MPNLGRVKDNWIRHKNGWTNLFCGSRFRGMLLEYRKMPSGKFRFFWFKCQSGEDHLTGSLTFKSGKTAPG